MLLDLILQSTNILIGVGAVFIISSFGLLLKFPEYIEKIQNRHEEFTIQVFKKHLKNTINKLLLEVLTFEKIDDKIEIIKIPEISFTTNLYDLMGDITKGLKKMKRIDIYYKAITSTALVFMISPLVVGASTILLVISAIFSMGNVTIYLYWIFIISLISWLIFCFVWFVFYGCYSLQRAKLCKNGGGRK